MERSIITTNSKEAQKHLNKSTSMGGKIGFAVNSDNEVIELLYKSQPKLKDMKKLIDLGFTQFIYTFAFLPFDKSQIKKTIDLMSDKEVIESFEYMSQF